MTADQHSDNPPQFDALSADTGVVSVAIGYNDLGFTGYMLQCELIDLTQPAAPACSRYYSPGGVDSTGAVIGRLAPEIAGVISGIRARAPHARVLVLGYPDVLPATTGCWPAVAISSADIPWLNGVEQRFNAMLAQQAQAAGVTYVDTYGPSATHDVCQRSDRKWIEAIVPSSVAVPLHPNAIGEQQMAAELQHAITQPAAAPAPKAKPKTHRRVRRHHKRRRHRHKPR